jgi:hypothetical protein
MNTDLKDKIFIYCKYSILFYMLENAVKKEDTAVTKLGHTQGHAIYTGKTEIKRNLEDTVKSRMENILDNNLPAVSIHTGGQNQEILRKAGAVALTRGRDIYIREEEYNEGFEATDAILLHELMHVVQYENKIKLTTKEEIAEAEKGAERAENLAYHAANSKYYARIGDDMFYLDRKTENKAIDHAISLLERTVKDAVMREDIQLLVAIQVELERTI